MKVLYLIAFLMILACGAPYVATSGNLPQNANTAEPYWTSTPETPITVFVLEPLTVRQKPCVSSVKDGYKNTGDLVELSGAEYICPDGGRWVHLVGGGWVNKRYLEER